MFLRLRRSGPPTPGCPRIARAPVIRSARGLVLVLALSGVLALLSMAVAAQADSGLSGTWTIDPEASQFPREIGFNADFVPFSGADGSSGARGRRGGGGAPGAQPMLTPRGESYEVATRRQQLTDEVRNPPVRLTIVETPDTVTIGDDSGNARTFHTDGRAESLLAGTVPVLTVARRDAGALVVLYAVADLRQIRYTFSRPEGASSLFVDVEFVERGQLGDKVRRVYTSAAAASGARPGGTASNAGSGGTGTGEPADGRGAPSSNPASAAVPRAGSEFAGLSRIGIVVEELSTQAVSCGLKRELLEKGVAKPFVDAGLKASTNADEDTYVHVAVMTSSLPNGMCISRYDWSVYSTTEATLSYQRAPLLVQVLLAHKGGLTGSLPATHGDDVLRGLEAGLTQVATIIRDANR